MSNYNKLTALYSRLSVGDEERAAARATAYRVRKEKGLYDCFCC